MDRCNCIFCKLTFKGLDNPLFVCSLFELRHILGQLEFIDWQPNRRYVFNRVLDWAGRRGFSSFGFYFGRFSSRRSRCFFYNLALVAFQWRHYASFFQVHQQLRCDLAFDVKPLFKMCDVGFAGVAHKLRGAVQIHIPKHLHRCGEIKRSIQIGNRPSPKHLIGRREIIRRDRWGRRFFFRRKLFSRRHFCHRRHCERSYFRLFSNRSAGRSALDKRALFLNGAQVF